MEIDYKNISVTEFCSLLAHNSLTISELINSRCKPLHSTLTNAAKNARIGAWKKIFNDNTGTLLEERWNWLPERDLLDSWLAVREVSHNESIPTANTIAVRIEEALFKPLQLDTPTLLSVIDLNPLKPIVDFRIENIRRRINKQNKVIFVEDVYNQLDAVITQKIISLITPCLYSEYTVFRQRHLGSIAGIRKSSYPEFLGWLSSQQYRPLWKQYPVLARVISSVLLNFEDSVIELIDRTIKDLELLQQLSLYQDLPLVIKSLHIGAGDKHNRGRSSCIIESSTGNKIVYKPRSAETDELLRQILETITEASPNLPFQSPKYRDSHTHSWFEYINNSPCQNEAEIKEAYQKIGGLCALVFLLGGNDCHVENLICNRAAPIIIDAETILHPHSSRLFEASSLPSAVKQALLELSQGVESTGFVPRVTGEVEGVGIFDLSALGGTGIQQTPYRVLSWDYSHNNKPTYQYDHMSFKVDNSLPRLEGEASNSLLYAKDILQGFEEYYKVILSQRNKLLCELPTRAASIDGRFVLRPTMFYEQVSAILAMPNHLMSGIDWSIAGDRLIIPFLDGKGDPKSLALLDDELNCILEGDVPYFSAKFGSKDLQYNIDKVAAGYLEKSALDCAKERLQAASITKLQKERKRLAVSLGEYTSSTIVKSVDWGESECNDSELINEAVHIGELVLQEACHGDDGGLTWLVPTSNIVDYKRIGYRPPSSCLYAGSSGILLFFSALFEATQDQRWYDLSLKVLKGSEWISGVPSRISLFEPGLGLGAGISSAAYALHIAGNYLKMPTLTDRAIQITTAITHSLIERDNMLDVLTGSAGALHALSALYDDTHTNELLLRIQMLADHLVANRVTSEHHGRAWKSIVKNPLTGFSHGAAGISLALLRAFKFTADERYRKAALEGIEYENSLIDPVNGHWADLRDERTSSRDRAEISCKWCHGACGIGISRVAICKLFPELQAALQPDINRSLKLTLELQAEDNDCPCCGNLGCLELLLQAGSDLRAKAKRRLAWLYQLRKKQVIWQCKPFTSADIINPGLFQGLSGVGYQLLRIVDPDKFIPFLTLGSIRDTSVT